VIVAAHVDTENFPYINQIVIIFVIVM